MRHLLYLLLPFVLFACSKKEEPKAPAAKAKPTHYSRNISNMGVLTTYDLYGQKIADGECLYVEPNIVVTTFDFLKGAFSAKMNHVGAKHVINVFGYVGYDIDANLVALHVGDRIKDVNPLDTLPDLHLDTLYTLDSKNGKMIRSAVTSVGNKLMPGTAIFNTDGDVVGISDGKGDIINSTVIKGFARKIGTTIENIYDLRLKTNKVYTSYTQISGFRIVTTMGNIVIKLYNETPEYRDNFIRLVSDGYYDSLLVHRVLPNYLIQTGAADSKYAKADDIVGWQGPGYKLPMRIVDGLFHRRGVVSASKLPSDHNASNRSDGAQFFIVAGRKFTSADLDQIEKEYSKKFTASQREAYTTVGGAPYLDGDYTIFGEVTQGMDIVDKIAAVEVNVDRPVKDIRVKKIEMIRR